MMDYVLCFVEGLITGFAIAWMIGLFTWVDYEAQL